MRSCGHPPWLQSRTLRKSRTKVGFLLLLSLKLKNISLEAMDKLLQAFLPFSGFKISLLFHSCLRYGLQMTLYCSGVSVFHLTLGAAGINLGSCDQKAKKLADHAQGISCGCQRTNNLSFLLRNRLYLLAASPHHALAENWETFGIYDCNESIICKKRCSPMWAFARPGTHWKAPSIPPNFPDQGQ